MTMASATSLRQRGRMALLNAVHANSTSVRYLEALRRFLNWCNECQEEFHSPEQCDQILADYIGERFILDGGRGYQDSMCCYYSIRKFYPQARGRMPESLQLLRGWKKAVKGDSYPPLSIELTCAIAIKMVHLNRPLAGLGALLAFDTLLRISELCGLAVRDVVDCDQPYLADRFRGLQIRLASTKTGPNQFVNVESPAVANLLRKAVASRDPAEPLIGLSPAAFRVIFKHACAQLGLSSAYVPHSLRHGGATHLFVRGVPVEDILIRGRWRATDSARRYIQMGRAALLAAAVPPAVYAAGVVFARDIEKAFVYNCAEAGVSL